MMKQQLWKLQAVLLALALFAAACGSDSGSTDTAEGDTGAETTETESDSGDDAMEGSDSEDDAMEESDSGDAEGAASSGDNCGLGTGEAATGDPIPIGAISGATGPDDFSSASDAAAAYFDCVNANGGINGRPINYLVEDDQWTPEVAGQAAAKLVNDEGVVAMVGGASFVECGVNAELYATEGVISVPGVGVPRQCFESTNIAPTNEGPRLSTIGVAQYAVNELGSESVVCIALAIPGLGDWSCGGVEEWGATAGVSVVTQLIDPALPDPTAVVLDAMSESPDLVIASLPAGAAIAVLGAAEQQDAGNGTVWSGPTSLYDVDLPGAVGPYWNDNLYVQIELAELDSSGADNQNWLTIMDAYGSDDDPRDSFSQAGFMAASVATEALLAIEDPSSINRETAGAALQAAQVSSDLVCGPWYFAEGESFQNANHAGRIVVQSGDAWSTLTDCVEVEDEAISSVLAFEAANGIGG